MLSVLPSNKKAMGHLQVGDYDGGDDDEDSDNVLVELS